MDVRRHARNQCRCYFKLFVAAFARMTGDRRNVGELRYQRHRPTARREICEPERHQLVKPYGVAKIPSPSNGSDVPTSTCSLNSVYFEGQEREEHSSGKIYIYR